MSWAGGLSFRQFSIATSRALLLGALAWSSMTLGHMERVVAADGDTADSNVRANPPGDNQSPLPPSSATESRTTPASGAEATLASELEQLSRERQSLTSVRNAVVPSLESESVSAQRDVLKQQLQFLVTELARRPKSQNETEHANRKRRTARKSSHSPPKSDERKVAARNSDNTPMAVGGTMAGSPVPVDSIALAQTLFRTHDYPGALRAFEEARKATSVPRDRISLKYFSAVCLRRMGQTQESMVMFREVANSRADDVLAECARWQLSMQQWRESTRNRIEQLQSAKQVGEEGASRETGGDGSQSLRPEENATPRE